MALLAPRSASNVSLLLSLLRPTSCCVATLGSTSSPPIPRAAAFVHHHLHATSPPSLTRTTSFVQQLLYGRTIRLRQWPMTRQEMAHFPDNSPLPSPPFTTLTRVHRSNSSAKRTLSPSFAFPTLQQTSLLPSTRTLFISPRRPLLSAYHRRAADTVSRLASVAASSIVQTRSGRQRDDDGDRSEESSLLLALPLLPIPSPIQPTVVSTEAQHARERAEAEDEAEAAQAAAFLLSPVRSPKRKGHVAGAGVKDDPRQLSRPTRSGSGGGHTVTARPQRHNSSENFTDFDRLFSGELLLDDDDDEVYEPTTPHSSSSLSLQPDNSAIAARTRARNPVELSWDELEQQSGPVLDIAEAELDTRNKRKRKRTDLLSLAGDDASAELSSDLSLLNAGGELPGAVYDDPFQRFVFSMHNDAPVSEDDEEFIPPPADEDDMDEYRDDRSTRVSRRELRELQGDAQLMQQDEGPAVEIDPDTLDIVDVSKRKRPRQRGRSIERSPFSPPYPAVYDTHVSSFSSSGPPASLGEGPSVLFDAIGAQVQYPSAHLPSSLALLPSPFVLPKADVSVKSAHPALCMAAHSMPSIPAASQGLLSVGQLQNLRHQFNDHVQLLIQSRCLAQWWPEQNGDILSITANIAAMMVDLMMLTVAHSPSNVPMLGMWHAITTEERQNKSPLVLPTSKSLRDERRADMPLLDEWYGLVAQPNSVLLHSALHTALLNCDWNPSLRLVLHLRRAPLFTRSEDELLKLAFSPGGVCHSPLGLPVYPDWAKVQQRYLPSKSVEEIRKRFHNVRCKETDEQHPLKRVKLHAGATGAKHELDDEEMAMVEAAVKEGERGRWAQLCRTSRFAGWDRRTLKRTYEKCKRARAQASGQLKAETSNIESPSPPSASHRAPPSVPDHPSRSVAASQDTTESAASPSVTPLSAHGGTKGGFNPSAVMCDGGGTCEVQWSKRSDRQLLLSARQYGVVVEQWPYVAVSTLQTALNEATSSKRAGAVSVVAIAERLTLLLTLITHGTT